MVITLGNWLNGRLSCEIEQGVSLSYQYPVKEGTAYEVFN